MGKTNKDISTIIFRLKRQYRPLSFCPNIYTDSVLKTGIKRSRFKHQEKMSQFLKWLKGDLSLPGYNNLGPFNDIQPSTNELDEAARVHDIAYQYYLDTGNNPYLSFNPADEEFLQAAPDTPLGRFAKAFFNAKKSIAPQMSPTPSSWTEVIENVLKRGGTDVDVKQALDKFNYWREEGLKRQKIAEGTYKKVEPVDENITPSQNSRKMDDNLGMEPGEPTESMGASLFTPGASASSASSGLGSVRDLSSATGFTINPMTTKDTGNTRSYSKLRQFEVTSTPGAWKSTNQGHYYYIQLDYSMLPVDNFPLYISSGEAYSLALDRVQEIRVISAKVTIFCTRMVIGVTSTSANTTSVVDKPYFEVILDTQNIIPQGSVEPTSTNRLDTTDITPEVDGNLTSQKVILANTCAVRVPNINGPDDSLPTMAQYVVPQLDQYYSTLFCEPGCVIPIPILNNGVWRRLRPVTLDSNHSFAPDLETMWTASTNGHPLVYAHISDPVNRYGGAALGGTPNTIGDVNRRVNTSPTVLIHVPETAANGVTAKSTLILNVKYEMTIEVRKHKSPFFDRSSTIASNGLPDPGDVAYYQDWFMQKHYDANRNIHDGPKNQRTLQ
nr:MAG: putative capsid protein [Red panda feces-associated parvovirus]